MTASDRAPSLEGMFVRPKLVVTLGFPVRCNILGGLRGWVGICPFLSQLTLFQSADAFSCATTIWRAFTSRWIKCAGLS